MAENKGHTSFEKGFRDSFKDFMQSPDPALWSRIEAGLQRRKKIILFTRLAVAASLLLLFGVSGWLVFRTADHDLIHSPVVTHEVEQRTNEKDISDPSESKISEKETITTSEIQHDQVLTRKLTEDKTPAVAGKTLETFPSASVEPQTTAENIFIVEHNDSMFPETTETWVQTDHELAEQKLSDPKADIIPADRQDLLPSPELTEILVQTDHELAEQQLADPKADIIPADRQDLLPSPEPEQPAQPKPELAVQQPPDPKMIDLLLQTEDFLPEKTREKSWQLALGYGTIQGQSVSDPATTFDAATANFRQDPFSSKLATETSRFSNVEKTTHSQPITFGILVNRNFSETWGVETGLLLTRLKTTSTTNLMNDEYTEYGSELLYVGLPASVRLNMIRGRRFGMYLLQGVVLEKGVRTRYYYNQYLANTVVESGDESYMADGVQISSLTALGFEFRLSTLLSIYGQPGLQFFFLNETQPYNIRSSSAIWPSLQMGLKVQL